MYRIFFLAIWNNNNEHLSRDAAVFYRQDDEFNCRFHYFSRVLSYFLKTYDSFVMRQKMAATASPPYVTLVRSY